MSKLIILKGLPASGKSTKAKEILEASGNAVRLNKDLLRTMLHFDRWTGLNEGVTKDMEKVLAIELLERDKVVIIDDTNLNEGTLDSWKALAGDKHTFEVIEMEADWKECLMRDRAREKRVGDHVIIGMARQYGLYDYEKPDVIVDIDGTIANIEHRLHFVKQEPKDWKGFFGAMDKDTPREDVLQLVNDLESKGLNICYVSGRPDEYREVTEQWLQENGAKWYYHTLFMRKAGDRRPDTEVKQEILNKYFRKDKIELVIDDRPSVIRMWQANGLPVMDVGNGVEF